MVKVVSLLDLLFGECRCRSISFCTLAIDRDGGIFLWFCSMAYMFKAVGNVVDEYFAPALEKMADFIAVPEQIFGSRTKQEPGSMGQLLIALSSAIGSSIPEFMASVMAAFFFGFDFGLGTQVGSAVLNLLAVTGVAMVVACDRGRVTMWAYPMVRDSIFYAISLLELCFALWDSRIVWYEALIMIVTYAAYMACLYLDNQLVDIFAEMGLLTVKVPQQEELQEQQAQPAPLTGAHFDKEALKELKVGQKVDVTSNVNGRWFPGTVCSCHPELRANAEGWAEVDGGHTWDFYRPPQLPRTEGPFTSAELAQMFEQGKLPKGVQVRRTTDDDFATITDYFPEGHEPFKSKPMNPSQVGERAKERRRAKSLQKNVVADLVAQPDDAERMCSFLNRFAVLPWGVLGTSLNQDSVEETVGEEPDEDTVVMDSATLDCIQVEGPGSAVGQSRALYRWLGINQNVSFPKTVGHSVHKESHAKLYEKYGGKGDLDGKFEGEPNRRQAVIHAVGPDLRHPRYNPHAKPNREAAQKVLTTAYKNVLEEFVLSKRPHLRLVPLNMGALCGDYQSSELAHMTAEAIGRGFLELSPDLQDKVLQAASLTLCIYAEEDHPVYIHGMQVAVLECEDLLLPDPDSHVVQYGEEKETYRLIDQLPADPFEYLLDWCMPDDMYTFSSHLKLFLASSVAIFLVYYMLLDFTLRFGCVLRLTPFITGKVFLGPGGASGDVMQSKAVAEDGEGMQMVVTILGPLVFRVQIALGLPWLLCCMLGWEVRLSSNAWYDVMALAVIFVLVVFSFVANGWHMTKGMGQVFLASYVLYVVVSLAEASDVVEDLLRSMR